VVGGEEGKDNGQATAALSGNAQPLSGNAPVLGKPAVVTEAKQAKAAIARAQKAAAKQPSIPRAPLRARQVECGHFVTAVISRAHDCVGDDDGNDCGGAEGGGGVLWIWGSNEHHVLGLGGTALAKATQHDRPCRSPVFGGARGDPACVDVDLGSVYAAAIDDHGQLYTWGYGGHGNLGASERGGAAVERQEDYGRG
jgi:hypothetical protein